MRSGPAATAGLPCHAGFNQHACPRPCRVGETDPACINLTSDDGWSRGPGERGKRSSSNRRRSSSPAFGFLSMLRRAATFPPPPLCRVSEDGGYSRGAWHWPGKTAWTERARAIGLPTTSPARAKPQRPTGSDCPCSCFPRHLPRAYPGRSFRSRTAVFPQHLPRACLDRSFRFRTAAPDANIHPSVEDTV